MTEYLNKKTAVSAIILEYRKALGTRKKMTFRSFAGELSGVLEKYGKSISYQSIKNWEDMRYLPDEFMLLEIRRGSKDWRFDFAGDLLAALRPDEYAPVSDIGRRILFTGRQK